MIASLVSYPLLYLAFTHFKPHALDAHHSQSYIPVHLLPPDIDPKALLLDPKGAVFHTVLLSIVLFTLVGTSFIPGVEVYMITAPGMVIAVVRDFYSERSVEGQLPKKRNEPEVTIDGDIELEAVDPAVKAVSQGEDEDGDDIPLTATVQRLSLPGLVKVFIKRFPATSGTISRLPLTLLLFAGESPRTLYPVSVLT